MLKNTGGLQQTIIGIRGLHPEKDLELLICLHLLLFFFLNWEQYHLVRARDIGCYIEIIKICSSPKRSYQLFCCIFATYYLLICCVLQNMLHCTDYCYHWQWWVALAYILFSCCGIAMNINLCTFIIILVWWLQTKSGSYI